MAKAGRQKRPVEQWVYVGKEARVKVRVIFMPLPAAVVAERVRKAKADRDKRLNHSPDYYEWLACNVFITNADKEKVSDEQVAAVYKIRWQIEVMFKVWKSGFGMQQMLVEKGENIHRVKSSIYLLLLFICLVMQQVYYSCADKVSKQHSKAVSIMKLATYVMNHLTAIICLSPQQLTKQIAAHCCYEKRNDRTNMADLINNLYPLT